MSMPIITPSDVTREEAITDIIESVALEETALSHILNAEGEKLQAVIAIKEVNAETLLATNKSVKAMVDAVTRLEVVLQSKLALFEDCICEPVTPKP
ncbi:MAG: hypothetical protein RR630_02905 [Coprobacillus sp.]